MEPAVIATTAILLTLVVGIVVQTAVSYVKKAKKAKKQAKDKRKRPESNKENVVPSSDSYRAPSASSFVTSSGQTKITEESHYQQIKSSVIRSESPAAPTTVVKHETTKTEKISTGDKIPSSFKLVQSSVPASISSVSKTRQQEVTEHSTYQQIHSTAVHSDQAQTSETTENQTKSNAEKLIPLCVEAFQDSVLSPISGIKKTKKEEVIENSHYEENLSNVNHRETSSPVPCDSPLARTSITETSSSVAEKLLPMCVEAFQDSVLSPISGISKTKTREVEEQSHVRQSKSTSVRPMSPAIYRSSPKPWSPTSETTPIVKEVLPRCVEVSSQFPINGIPQTKRQEVLEQSNYQSSASSITSLVRCLSPKPWTAPETETKSPTDERAPSLETVTESSHYKHIHQQNEASSSLTTTTREPRIWMSVSEVRTKRAAELLPLCVEAFQDSVLSPISGIKKTKKQDTVIESGVTDSVEYEQNIARVKQFWHERTTNGRSKSNAAKNLLPFCVEAFQDSVRSPISGTKYRSKQKVTETSYRQQTFSSASRTGAPQFSQNVPKPSTAPVQPKPPAEKLLPLCVEAFQDSVLSPISGIKKTKTQEIQSNVIRSVTPPVSPVGPKPWKPDTAAKSSTAGKLLPFCVEAFQDSVLSPISGISRTKKQEIQSGLTRSPTPPVPNTVPKPWKSEPQTSSPAAARLLPMCVEAFQDSVLSPISGIPKTKKQEISSSPIRFVTPPVHSLSPKPWKPASSQATSSAEKLLPLCVEAFQDSVLSPISGISKTKKEETIATEPSPEQSAGEKLLPLCVEAFQDSVLSPISGIKKTESQEVVKSTTAKVPPEPSAGEKVLPLCVEAFQDSVLSPISGIKKTKNQEMGNTADVKPSAEPSAGEKLLPLCAEAFQDSILSPISGIKKTKSQEVEQTADPTAEPTSGEKLLPLCVEAFQDSVLSPISGVKKTKNQELAESADAKPPVEPSAREKLLPLCVEAFQDSVLSPISGIKKTKNQEVTESSDDKPPAEPSAGEKLLPLCVEAFQDSVLSPISDIKKTKKQEVAVEKPVDPSAGEKLLPLCVEAFQDSVLSPISGIKKTKNEEVTEAADKPHVEPSAGGKLLPLCVEAFQDSVLSPISGIKKTKNQEVVAAGAGEPKAQPSAGGKLLPLCVEAFQDSVLSPISGIKKTKNEEPQSPVDESSNPRDVGHTVTSALPDSVRNKVADYMQEAVIRSQTPPVKQNIQLSNAYKPIPVSVETFRASVGSPVSGVSRTKTEEVTQDGSKTEKTTTETIQETKGSCQTTILRKEKESVVRDSFVPQNRPVFRPTPLSALTTHTGTLPGTINTTTFESKASETRQSMWKPTGAVAEKVKGYSSNQPKFSSTSIQTSITTSSDIKQRPISCPDASIFDREMKKEPVLAGTANKPVAPVAEPIVSRNVYQQSEKQSSTFPRRKKQFSSSSFYEDEYSSFPTLEEQVQLCRQIADSLVDDSGKKSKGASMFDRRMKRSTSWIHENPEEEISPTPEQTEQNVEKKEVAEVDISQSPKSKPSLKLILDPRLPQDVAMLKTSGQQISEHNVISPDICHDLVKDLQSPVGKGGALFAKRKKKAEDWVVDEDKVKEHTKTPEPLPEPPVPPLHKLKEKFQHPKLKLVKSPWEAALQSPIGSVDSAFVDVKPTKLAETVKQAADIKVRSNSQSPVSDSGSISHPYPFTPPASGVYKPIVPRGWTGRTAPAEYDSKPSSVGFTSPEPPLMPSSPFSSAPINKPTFQNFNTTPKSWNEAKKADSSQSPGFKPVRLPAYYTK